MKTEHIGKPTSRVDGRAKVTGAAQYAAEYNVPGLVYGVVVSSAIAKGKITRIDATDALQLPGVLQVFSHENSPPVATAIQRRSRTPGSFSPLQEKRINTAPNPSLWSVQ
jgi:xanthine dehydrogenase YagR molybdenum-binding subunit